MAFLDLLFLFCASCLWIRSLNILPTRAEQYAVAWGIGWGLKSFILFGFVASNFQPVSFLQTLVSLMIFLGSILLWKDHAMCSGPESSEGSQIKDFIPSRGAFIILLFLLTTSALNAWFFPVTETDGLWYQINGTRYYHETRFDTGVFNSDYAPFIQLLVSFFISADWYKVKLLFPAFYLCWVVIFYCRVHDQTQSKKLATLSTLVLATTPYFWWHSVLLYLNLAAGFFFSLGIIFWIKLLNQLQTFESGNPKQWQSWALLSGCFIGLSCWTRIEFLLYASFPFLALMIVLDRNPDIQKTDKSPILLKFSTGLLIPPSLWLINILTFEHAINTKFYGVMGVCFILWVALIVFLFKPVNVTLSNALIKRCIWVSILCYLFLFFVAGPKSLPPWTAIYLGVYRTLFFQLFFSFTVLLGLVIFLNSLKDLSTDRLYTGLFLIFYMLTHYALYTFAEPKWQDLGSYLDATFIHPGNSANSSGTREMLAFYPVFVFFVSNLPWVKASFEHE